MALHCPECGFVNPEGANYCQKCGAYLGRPEGADEPTTIEHLLDHFDHVAKLIGPEHLGVGSDIDLYGYDRMPAALNKQLRAGYKGSYGFRERS